MLEVHVCQLAVRCHMYAGFSEVITPLTVQDEVAQYGRAVVLHLGVRGLDQQQNHLIEVPV